jgi:hypothetical protein
MKPLTWFIGVSMLFLFSCTKSKEAPPLPTLSQTSATVATPATTLVDPVNCPPTLIQSNANAFQINYARMKLVKSMSGQMKGITPDIIANYAIHVYLRGSNGKYYHLPATTVANVSYNFTLTSAFPQSSISIRRGAGPEEIFESVIVLGAKASHLVTFNPQLNFADYGAVKTKLGF